MEDNYRILVIDDVQGIHEDFRKILIPDLNEHRSTLDQMNSTFFGKIMPKASHPPFKIDSAYQGRDGLMLVKNSIAVKKPYAVAFVDVQMPPGEDGVDTINHIWEIDKEIQTVICTAYAKYSWEEIYDKFGDTDRLYVIKKPFDNIEILQLASTLTKKWNLNHALNEKLHLRNTHGSDTDLENSIRTMENALNSLMNVRKKIEDEFN